MNERLNTEWITLSAEERIERVLISKEGNAVLTSSFGAQSIVLIDIFQKIAPNIPVWLIDTGYLFAETYHYIDQVSNHYSLNLNVIRPELSPSWIEARFGELWRGDKVDLQKYNKIVKVNPLQQAMKKNEIDLWFSGLRWHQSYDRAQRKFIEKQDNLLKVHPILDWSDERVAHYIKTHKLPEHPLVAKGYQSIGDRHSSRPVIGDEQVEKTRFNGMARECGIHLDWN